MSIGVFDSGIGGLTVLRELARTFEHESFLYLGDTARLPYGSKSPLTIRKYAEQNLKFLISKNVKALVIACNSASAQVPEKTFQGLPVFNVIRPGAAHALKATHTKRIGVIATRATVQSGAYEQALLALDPTVKVFSQPAPLLVPLAEEGWVDDPVTNLITFRYLQPLLKENIDTLILACTHYPILKSSIQKVAGAHVQLVDSGTAVCEELACAFASGEVAPQTTGGQRQLHLYCTDTASSFRNLATRLLSEYQLECSQFLMADLTEIG